MASENRIIISEQDRAASILANNPIYGAMVLKSKKGMTDKFRLYEKGVSQIIEELGEPSALYNSVFEALSFSNTAPIWLISAVGSGAKYGGVFVTNLGVSQWGVGLTDPSSMVFTAALQKGSESLGTGNGISDTFAGSLAHTLITNDTFVLKQGTTILNATMDGSGVITGSPISAGTITLATGAYSIQFTGTPGSVASYTSLVDASTTIDLSIGGTDKVFNLNIDGTLYENINLGQSATASRAEIMLAINTAVGQTVATPSGNFIKISGLVGDAINGKVIISNPTVGVSAVALVFDDLFTGTPIIQDTASVSSTGAIPRNGQVVNLDYSYSADLSATVSHVFYSSSQRPDDCRVSVEWLGGQRFKLVLYTLQKNGSYAYKTEYTYSLISEQDNFGNQLYIEDVFEDDPYLKFKVNPLFSSDYLSFPVTPALVTFFGGDRGADPSTSDLALQWDKVKDIPINQPTIYMEPTGAANVTSAMKNARDAYGEYSFSLATTPYGKASTVDAIAHKNTLSFDSDNIALSTNWWQISDNFNNSKAWISGIGEIGANLALSMNNSYGFQSIAGTTENGVGGVLSYYTRLKPEVVYTDNDLNTFRTNKINPITFKNGVIQMRGDNTLKVDMTDTSFLNTRVGYNYLIRNIRDNVMFRMLFKRIDTLHMLQAKNLTESIVNPVFVDGWLRDYRVICDDTNNTDQTKNLRQLVLTVIVKVMPKAQEVKLNFIRVDQATVLASVS